jgi:hypothetical protein
MQSEKILDGPAQSLGLLAPSVEEQTTIVEIGAALLVKGAVHFFLFAERA